jgi:hypothetical protein
METNQNQNSSGRKTARVNSALEVTVEVAGEKRLVTLVSKDIGTGGMFLRTNEPPALWKKVRLILNSPDGNILEVGGEVVRSVSIEKSKLSGHPPGMAVAFDDVSRTKRKQLVALVLDLCDKQQEEPVETPKPPTTQTPEQALESLDVNVTKIDDTSPPASEPENDSGRSNTDSLLSEIDDLLSSVSSNLNKISESKQSRPTPAESSPQTSQAAQTQESGMVDIIRKALERYNTKKEGDTYYDILMVSKQANQTEITEGYNKLMKQLGGNLSPDLLPADLAKQLTEVVSDIKKSYAILTKPDRKRAYDFLIDNEVDDL